MQSSLVKIVLLASTGLMATGVVTAGYDGHIRVGQPKTVIHVVSIQWKAGISDQDKERVFGGVKKMAASIPGVRNVWIQSERVEPRGFGAAFVIEFENRAAADA